MLKNVPEAYGRDCLAALLDGGGLSGQYDFLYMPINFRSGKPIGYAVVNFASAANAQHCFDIFQGFSDWDVFTDKVCDPTWSEGSQGLTEHVHRYRNCPLMHETVPDSYKPAMYVGGLRVPFPEPTKPIRKPRLRKALSLEQTACADDAPDAIGESAAEAKDDQTENDNADLELAHASGESCGSDGAAAEDLQDRHQQPWNAMDNTRGASQ